MEIVFQKSQYIFSTQAPKRTNVNCFGLIQIPLKEGLIQLNLVPINSVCEWVKGGGLGVEVWVGMGMRSHDFNLCSAGVMEHLRRDLLKREMQVD